MKIQPYFYHKSQHNFKQNLKEEFMSRVPNTKTAKDLTQLDAASMQAYVLAKPYTIKISQEEVDNLKKLDGVDFILESYDFLTKKLGLSEEIRPYLNIIENINAELKMAYMPVNNIILCSKNKVISASKENIFAMLRHELQHYIQNISALRHETYGEKAIEKLVEKYKKQEKMTIINLFKMQSEEQTIENLKDHPEALAEYKMYKSIYESGDEEKFDKLFDANAQRYREEMQRIQEKIKKELGVIPASNPLSKTIKANFENLINPKYMKKDGSVNYAKYFKSPIEIEAMNAQNAAVISLAPNECGIKIMKLSTLESLDKERELFEKALKEKELKS